MGAPLVLRPDTAGITAVAPGSAGRSGPPGEAGLVGRVPAPSDPPTFGMYAVGASPWPGRFPPASAGGRPAVPPAYRLSWAGRAVPACGVAWVGVAWAGVAGRTPRPPHRTNPSAELIKG
ncbi:hypothetical protein AB0I76_22700, partial [Micromonospora sp. NPDC049799]